MRLLIGISKDYSDDLQEIKEAKILVNRRKLEFKGLNREIKVEGGCYQIEIGNSHSTIRLIKSKKLGFSHCKESQRHSKDQLSSLYN